MNTWFCQKLLRIGFAGGGSDYFNPNSNKPGRVIVSTINKYMYVCLNENITKQLEQHIQKLKMFRALITWTWYNWEAQNFMVFLMV